MDLYGQYYLMQQPQRRKRGCNGCGCSILGLIAVIILAMVILLMAGLIRGCNRNSALWNPEQGTSIVTTTDDWDKEPVIDDIVYVTIKGPNTNGHAIVGDMSSAIEYEDAFAEWDDEENQINAENGKEFKWNSKDSASVTLYVEEGYVATGYSVIVDGETVHEVKFDPTTTEPSVVLTTGYAQAYGGRFTIEFYTEPSME